MLQLQSTSRLILGIWRACCASSVLEQNIGSLGCQTASRSVGFAKQRMKEEVKGGLNTKIERGVSARADRKEVNQIEAAGGGERKEMGKISRAGYSHALYAGIGNCRVVEIACERRSSPDKETREGV